MIDFTEVLQRGMNKDQQFRCATHVASLKSVNKQTQKHFNYYKVQLYVLDHIKLTNNLSNLKTELILTFKDRELTLLAHLQQVMELRSLILWVPSRFLPTSQKPPCVNASVCA